MRNTGILIFLVGIYVIINSGSFRDVLLGKASVSFLNPKAAKNVGPRVRGGSYADSDS